VAFPRLNAFAFWLFLFGALIAMGGFITPGGAADFGWTAYSPLTDAIHSRAPVATCGSWAWPSVVWAPSWVRSTSSPPWSACVPPV
jgi:heme/copper-type cytochrome/quinol oxidase subunit 1